MQIGPTEIKPTRWRSHDGYLQQPPALTNLNNEKIEDKSQMICQGLPVKRAVITGRTPKGTDLCEDQPPYLCMESLEKDFWLFDVRSQESGILKSLA